MKLLLRTYADHVFYAGDPELGDLECAVIDATPDLVRRLEDQLKMVRGLGKADESLAQVAFHADTAGGPDFYDYRLIDACEDLCGSDWFDRFHDEGLAVLPAGIELGQFEPQPTEAECIDFWVPRSASYRESHGDHEFSWRATRKNGGISVHTIGLTLNHPLMLEVTKEGRNRPAEQQDIRHQRSSGT